MYNGPQNENLRKHILSNYHSENDKAFDEFLYPKYMQDISDIHWTPIVVAKKASELLTANGANQILDIGAGIGKFCIVGALHTDAIFYGIELRKDLYEIAEQTARILHLNQIRFSHLNITEVNFSHFDAYYFFNPFLENLHPINRIDNHLPLTASLFEEYTHYTKEQFASLPANSRVVTYCTDSEIMPSDYVKAESYFNNRLCLWLHQKSS